MGIVFHKPAGEELVKPFDSFPFGIELGSSLAILFSDPLSQAVFLSNFEAALLERGEVYHVSVGRSSIPPLGKITEKGEGFYTARTTKFEDVIMAIRKIPAESSLVVDGFSALRGITAEGILELLDDAGSKEVTLVLSQTPLVLNELDLPGEFQRNFLVPEVFDYLLALRSASYRGHYRMGVSAVRLPLSEVSFIGEHAVPIDSLVKKLL